MAEFLTRPHQHYGCGDLFTCIAPSAGLFENPFFDVCVALRSTLPRTFELLLAADARRATL